MRVLQMARGLPFDKYAANFLKIRTKEQGIQPFNLNVGQDYLDAMAERQLAVRNHVRIILLKARQWGGSTYIEGRFYRHIAQGARGKKAMIVTHRKDATSNLFKMALRFHQEMDPRLKPFSGRSSITQLIFPKRDSSYTVATAGAVNIGHSDTIQLLHASEFALWPNATEHLKGVFQTVPTGGAESEVWIESTGAGMGNEFHVQVDLARKKQSEYEFAFVPWFWFNDESQPVYYCVEPRKELMELMDAKDEQYMRSYGLDERQMAFRMLKVVEFGGGERGRLLFASQYPACPEDAFTTTGEGCYIDPLLVAAARKCVVARPYGPRIMGIDPAHVGKDRFSVHLRQGRKATIVGEWQGKRHTYSLGKCVMLIKEHRPDVTFIDAIGVGSGVVDPLLEMQHSLGTIIVPVNGGESADDEERYGNKNDEMAARTLEWLEMPHGVQIDDRDDVQRDICLLQGEYDRANRWRPESKQRAKTRLKGKFISPDHFDSLRLTFAFDISHLALGRAGAEIDPDRPINWRAM